MATSGQHNSDLAASAARFIQGASWKHQEIVTLLPCAKTVPVKAAVSWMHLLYPPNQARQTVVAVGLEVGEAYSEAIRQIIEHPQLKDFKFILTVESDNVAPPDGVLKLLQRMEEHPEFACIGGLYWTKGPAGCPQIWGDPKDPVLNFRPQPPDPAGGLVECCGTGMGFNLWRLSMFGDKRLRYPWFKTTCSAAEGVGTQDLYAWADFRKYGYRCAVDCSVLVGHYDVNADVNW